MIPFRHRNPVPIGLISILALTLLLVGAMRVQDLPLIGGGDTYYAAFSEAGGLKEKDEVRIAGVRVGQVKKLELVGDHVRVEFQVDTPSRFGNRTEADIKVKTLLGQMFLSLTPAGSGQMEEDAEIPVERTTSPYDVVEAFEGLAETAGEIDTDQLAKSMTTLADLTRNTPDEFRVALDGVSALSRNLAARDDEINTLLINLEKVAKILNERDGDILQLMDDADVLARALVARRDAVHNLLVATSQLSEELTLLIRQSRADLKPALRQLEGVVGLLNKNEDNLERSIRLMAPFYRVFANTLGNGPWFDTYIQNLPPVPEVGP